MPQPDIVATNQITAPAPLSREWTRALLSVALVWLAMVVVFHAEWAEMVSQWWNSSTYNHILLVPFICIWLVVLRAGQLAQLEPEAWWPGLILTAGALLVWLFGVAIEINSVRQFGVVFAMQAALVALTGPRIAVALAFPLFFMWFLVPFGEEIVPTMQLVTAWMTTLLVSLSGIPAHIDGVFIDTPAGLFEVAEACAGVMFLVAMVALGTLIAHLCFSSWKRRLLFVAASVVVPVLANGVRAWGTIFLAQSYGAETATGFDHIVYGWIFFALVMGCLFLAASPWFDRAANDQFVDVGALLSSRLLKAVGRLRIAAFPAAIGLTGLAVLGALWAEAMAADPPLREERISFLQPSGWQQVREVPEPAWLPAIVDAEGQGGARFRNSAGQAVDVAIARFAGVPAAGVGVGEWSWIEAAPAPQGGQGEYLRLDGVRRLAFTWYRYGDDLTGSRLRLKLATASRTFLLKREPVTLVIISAEDRQGISAADSISSFLAATGPLGSWLDRAAQSP